jgi:prepilin-type N-terminal cleavage/methylation domain-containing protein
MNRSRGFTLIELAIVLVVITILIGGLAMPLSAQIQARRIAETKKLMEEAREAIIGYAMGNLEAVDHDLDPATVDRNRSFLPCPDTDVDGVVDGTEDRDSDGSCLAYEGWFPSVTLGTATQDAWGNRLRYRVTAKFADASPGFFNTDDGDIQICSGSNCATGKVAENVPLVLLSHGPNGRGALSLGGVKLGDPSGADELENTDTDTEFVSRVPTTADHPNGEFDDLVVWLSNSLLTGRIRL